MSARLDPCLRRDDTVPKSQLIYERTKKIVKSRIKNIFLILIAK